MPVPSDAFSVGATGWSPLVQPLRPTGDLPVAPTATPGNTSTAGHGVHRPIYVGARCARSSLPTPATRDLDDPRARAARPYTPSATAIPAGHGVHRSNSISPGVGASGARP